MKLAVALALLAGLPAAGATLKPETVQAFDRYIRATEARLDQQRRTGPFLWVDQSPERLKEVRSGKVVIQPWNGNGDVEAPTA